MIVIKDDKRRLSTEGMKKRAALLDDIEESDDERSVGSSTLNEGGSILSTFWDNIRSTFPGHDRHRRRVINKLGSDYDRLSSRDNVIEYVDELRDGYSDTDTDEGREVDEPTESHVISVISSSHMAYKYVQ